MLFKLILLLAAATFVRSAEADNSLHVVTADQDARGNWYVLANWTLAATRKFHGANLPVKNTAVVIKYRPAGPGKSETKIDESFGENGFLFLDSLLHDPEHRFLELNSAADLVVHQNRVLVLANIVQPIDGELVTGNKPILFGITKEGKLDSYFGEGDDDDRTGSQTDVANPFWIATGRKISTYGDKIAVLSSDALFEVTRTGKRYFIVSRYLNDAREERVHHQFIGEDDFDWEDQINDPKMNRAPTKTGTDVSEEETAADLSALQPPDLDQFEAELERQGLDDGGLADLAKYFRLWLAEETWIGPSAVTVQNLAMDVNARGSAYVMGIANEGNAGRVVGFKYFPNSQHKGKQGRYKKLVRNAPNVVPKFDSAGPEFAVLPLADENAFMTAQRRPNGRTFLLEHDISGERTSNSRIIDVDAPFPLLNSSAGSFRRTAQNKWLLLGHAPGADKIAGTVVRSDGVILSRVELVLPEAPLSSHWCGKLIGALGKGKKKKP